MTVQAHAYIKGQCYLAAAASWLFEKLPWHLVVMTAVTTATAAPSLGLPSNLLPRKTYQVLFVANAAKNKSITGSES